MSDALANFNIVLGWVAHYAAAVPLAACGVLAFLALVRPGRRGPEIAGLMLAIAFALSYVVDTAAVMLLRNGLSNTWLTYVLAPVQFGLLLWIVAPATARRVMWIGFALVAMAAVSRGPFDHPETFVQVAAGAWVCLVALRHPAMPRYRAAVLTYCGLAIPFLIVLGTSHPVAVGLWPVAWTGYQLVRIVALVILTGAVVRRPADYGLKVVTDDSRRDGRARRTGQPDRGASTGAPGRVAGRAVDVGAAPAARAG